MTFHPMKLANLLLTFLLLSSLVSAESVELNTDKPFVFANKRAIQQWDYKVISVELNSSRRRKPTEVLQRRLNQLGNEGWEFVEHTQNNLYIFKRPRLKLKLNPAKK